MAALSIQQLKALWITGYRPTQSDFDDFFDSFINSSSNTGMDINFFPIIFPPTPVPSIIASGKGIAFLPDLSLWTVLVSVDFSNNVVSYYFPTTLPVTLLSVTFFNNSLAQASVDATLLALDNAGGLNGSCDLSGGTNSSPTGGAGNANLVSLQSKGWKVTTN